jgi:hypothetical protein
MLIGFSLLHADTDKEALGKLTARIGDKFWSPPEKRLVRATIYKKGKGADDGDSAKGKSDEKIGLRYATEKEAGDGIFYNTVRRATPSRRDRL